MAKRLSAESRTIQFPEKKCGGLPIRRYDVTDACRRQNSAKNLL